MRHSTTFAPPFVVRHFLVVGSRIVVTSHHHLYYPAQIAVLDLKGNLLREYWHPGHLNAMTTGQFKGKAVIFAGGVNNLRHAATLIALDPEKLSGAGIEEDGPAFEGFASGQEEARLLLPRSCMNRLEPYNTVVQIFASANGLVADVQERLRSIDPPSIQFRLTPDLQWAGTTVSDVFLSDHAMMHQAKQLDHTWTATEGDQLHDIVRLR
jgi:hypothetical protein